MGAVAVGAAPCSCACSSGADLGPASLRIIPASKRRISCVVRAGLMSDSSDSARGEMSGFIKRMEQTWLISKQPKPVVCSACQASGKQECPWCKGTGFFIIGDNMLCEVSSHNTSCYICGGKGAISCDQCKGTGYRAKWLGQGNLINN